MNELRALAIGLDRLVAKAESVLLVVFVAALALREGSDFGLDLLIRRVPALKPVLGPMVAIVTALFLLILLKTGIDETNLASRQFAMTFPMRMQWAYLALPTGAGLMLFHLAIHFIRSPSMHILDIRREPE